MHPIKRFLPYYKYLKPVRWQFGLGIAFGALYSLLSGLGLPVIAETIFPVVFEGPERAPDWLRSMVLFWFGDTPGMGFLIMCCLSLPLIALIRGLSSIGNGYFMTFSGVNVVQFLQLDVFRKVQSMPVAFFQKHNTGSLVAGVQGYPMRIKSVVVDMSNDLVKQPLTLLAAMCYVVYKSVLSDSVFIAVIALGSFALLVIPIQRIGAYLAKRSRQIVMQNEGLSSATIESIQSPIEIRAYNLQQSQEGRFKGMLDDILKLSMKSVRRGLLISPTVELVAATGVGLSLFLGVQSGMEQGEFIALVIALYISYKPLKTLAGMYGNLKRLEAPLDRLERILQAEDTVPDPVSPKSLPVPVRGEIQFENVEFDYLPDKPVLKNINVTIHAGETVALVGMSGAGKSSFVNLIPRFYDPGSGAVTIDGTDIREFRIKELRSQISYVSQNPVLFHASVEENIRMGRPDATDAEVAEAARNANAMDFIEELPQGMKSVLLERGSSISGGQRQRIALARAFLRDAPILIFDEATSALDNEKDRRISEAMERLFKDRTTLIIAHRMSTIKNIERRLFFHAGRLVADGGHEELCKKTALYTELMAGEYGANSGGG